MSDDDGVLIELGGTPPNPSQPIDKTIVGVVFHGAFMVEWQTKNAGFGQLTFASAGGVVRCDSERMSREFVLSVLAKLVETARMDWENDEGGT